MFTTISSTGFNGASQGALAFAFINDLKIIGICPHNYLFPTGDESKISSLGIVDHEFYDLYECIEHNIKKSDAALVFYEDDKNSHELYIEKQAKAFNIPYIEIDINKPTDPRILQVFMGKHNTEVLYVDGRFDQPDEKEVHSFVIDYMNRLMYNINLSRRFKHAEII